MRNIALFSAMLLTAASSSAYADIIVDVQDLTLNAGGSGFVDVLISSTGSDNLDFASYDFAITNVGAPSSTLQFANPQDLSEDGLATYVFAGDNLGINEFTLTNSQFVADDATLSGTGITLTAATRLLARLELEHVLGGGQTVAQADGEQFRITLQNTADTAFDDEMFNPLTVDVSSFDSMGVGGGLVTLQAAAVPEPGTFAFCGLGALVLIWRRRRNHSGTSD